MLWEDRQSVRQTKAGRTNLTDKQTSGWGINLDSTRVEWIVERIYSREMQARQLVRKMWHFWILLIRSISFQSSHSPIEAAWTDVLNVWGWRHKERKKIQRQKTGLWWKGRGKKSKQRLGSTRHSRELGGQQQQQQQQVKKKRAWKMNLRPRKLVPSFVVCWRMSCKAGAGAGSGGGGDSVALCKETSFHVFYTRSLLSIALWEKIHWKWMLTLTDRRI